MRCRHCNFHNVQGVTTSEACGRPLAVSECRRCGFVNPPEYLYCGGCGQPWPRALAEEPRRSRQSATKVIITSQQPAKPPKATPPIALVGFGAVLALGSATFPWYLFGAPQESGERNLSRVKVGSGAGQGRARNG